MSLKGYTVYVVEDDVSVRDALGLLLSLHGYAVAMFDCAERFLDALRPDWVGCALLDLRMPGMDGLVLQQRMLDAGCMLPVIVISAHGDVESARTAFRANAVDFLEKPLDHGRLMNSIAEAFARQERSSLASAARTGFDTGVAALTPREREVMDRVVQGCHNREIAEGLKISPRTVEVHKARMMAKLGVSTVADLVRLALRA